MLPAASLTASLGATLYPTSSIRPIEEWTVQGPKGTELDAP